MNQNDDLNPASKPGRSRAARGFADVTAQMTPRTARIGPTCTIVSKDMYVALEPRVENDENALN